MKNDINVLEFMIEFYEGVLNNQIFNNNNTNSVNKSSVQQLVDLEFKIKEKITYITKLIKTNSNKEKEKNITHRYSPNIGNLDLVKKKSMSKSLLSESFSTNDNSKTINDLKYLDFVIIYDLIEKFLELHHKVLSISNEKFIIYYSKFKRNENKNNEIEDLKNNEYIKSNNKNIKKSSLNLQKFDNKILNSNYSNIKKNSKNYDNKLYNSEEANSVIDNNSFDEDNQSKIIKNDSNIINSKHKSTDNSYEYFETKEDYESYLDANKNNKRNCCVDCLIF